MQPLNHNNDHARRICHAMNFISSNIGRDLSLDEIAQSASFSPYHFHRIFRAVVGETVAGFTRRVRLETAANRLVSNPTEDITHVSIDLGFSSSQNFAKAFKRHFNVTPTEYRASKIGNTDSKNGNVFTTQYEVSSLQQNLMDHSKTIAMNTEVENIPERVVAYIRKIGAYSKETCEPAFAELMTYAMPRQLVSPGTMLAIYWDNPEVTPPDKCRFDACITVPEGTEPEGQINIQKIRGGPYAIHHAEVKADDFQQAWDDAYVWLCNSNIEPGDGPCFEVYQSNGMEHPEGKWLIDICIPLKSGTQP